MKEDPFQFDPSSLVSQTLLLGVDAISLYGKGRSEVLTQWRLVLDMSKLAETEAVDWGQVRTYLWNEVPEEVLTDEVLVEVLTSVFTEICGFEEGLKGVSTVLARWHKG